MINYRNKNLVYVQHYWCFILQTNIFLFFDIQYVADSDTAICMSNFEIDQMSSKLAQRCLLFLLQKISILSHLDNAENVKRHFLDTHYEVDLWQRGVYIIR